MGIKNKNIIIGITGGIAAYKSAIICRLAKKAGAEIRIIMTPLAKEFITPLTLATLSKHPILVDFFNPENGDWNSHIDLGLWADAYLIAPATANTMAKMAHGIADNLLLTTYLSARCPVFIAPAMDVDMYHHPATLDARQILQKRGNHIIEPSVGELASGLQGKGRMEEPEEIIAQLLSYFSQREQFKGKRFLVTAGPTYEKIDPVRFIGNYSSGKMGYAIANELASRGATVDLVSGPVALEISHPNIMLHKVETTEQMYKHCMKLFPASQGAVLAAAVADFMPATANKSKTKRTKQKEFSIKLKPTRDIAAELGKQKTEKQTIIGFALETTNEIENATEKRKRKNFDFIVLNSLNDKGAGFEYDTNKITIIDKNEQVTEFPLKTKKEVAFDIVDKIYALL